MAPSTLAQWLGAVGTILAVIVALFKDPIIAWRRAPILVATCTKETPWTLRTPIMVHGQVPVHGDVTWGGDCYFVRIKVENTGRSRAEKVQVSAQRLSKRGADNRFVDLPTILPLNLKWANLGVPILDGISPKMSYFSDVFSLCDPGNPLQRRPAGALPTSTVAQLQLTPSRAADRSGARTKKCEKKRPLILQLYSTLRLERFSFAALRCCRCA